MAHIEETIGGYFRAALVVAVEQVVVEGDIADGSFVEVGNQHAFEFAELLDGIGVAEKRVADGEVG